MQTENAHTCPRTQTNQCNDEWESAGAASVTANPGSGAEKSQGEGTKRIYVLGTLLNMWMWMLPGKFGGMWTVEPGVDTLTHALLRQYK